MMSSLNKPTVMCLYKPKPACELKLLDVLVDHVPVLQGLGLATLRPATILKANDGTIIEMFEWVTGSSSGEAHSNPAVMKIWAAISEVADISTLSSLSEAGKPFSQFERIELKRSMLGRPSFVDTMIAAKNFDSVLNFYKSYLGLAVKDEQASYTTLQDLSSGQTLCITKGPSVKSMGLGLETSDIGKSLESLVALGGKVEKTLEFPKMKCANCLDIEGNELLVWQSL